jgi:hypothetical protein
VSAPIMSQRILFIFTSENLSLTDDSIVTTVTALQILAVLTLLQGWYLPEAAHPYIVLSPHFTIEFASPKGPNPPMDPTSFRVNTVPMATIMMTLFVLGI